MSGCGTIDNEAFACDLAAISQSNYPPVQLAKLPFNWYVKQATPVFVQGNTVTAAGKPANLSCAFSSPNTAGNCLIIDVMLGEPFAGAGALSITDTLGNSYTQVILEEQSDMIATSWICVGCKAGSNTVVPSYSYSSLVSVGAVAIHEYPNVTAYDSSAFVQAFTPTTASVTTSATGDLIHMFVGASMLNAFTAALGQTGTYTPRLTASAVESGFSACPGLATFDTIAGAPGIYSNAGTTTGSPTLRNVYLISFRANVQTTAGSPPPNNPISLLGPMNYLSLVSEAIDEDGQYWQSYSPSTGVGAGFVRMNGQGNVWIPVSLANPLMAGLATTADNYNQTPIASTGFGAIEAPFGKLDWQPSVPTFYAGAKPPTTPPGYLLAILSVSIGTGTAVGAGNSSTYAIPSAAGPVKRLKKACLL